MITMLKDWLISIHAPTRGATAVTTTKETDPVFQSTLPRGERRDVIYGDVKEIQISIHAPTRGATNDSGHFSFKNGISIHAPTRGATLKDISIFINTLDFNPRSHEGSDAAESAGATTLQLFQSTLPRGERRGGICRCCYFAAISIHAPTRGATQINKAGDTYQAFQSTLPRGERRFRSV